jgi:hypothetical protein
MNAFIIELADKPGALASVAEAIAQKGINITGFAGATSGGSGTAILITNDEAGTRSALATTGAKVREVELVTVGLENKPGALAEITRKLADAGINLEASLPTGMAGNTVHVAFATNDPAKARQVLGDKVMAGTMG